jgi:signal transduction histidine kinase
LTITDNAIHWIKGYTDNGSIFIELDGEDIIISNNGAPIDEADKESIFSMGFTKREFGRGIGLSIVQKALSEDGFKLSLATPADGFNVAFRISKEVL